MSTSLHQACVPVFTQLLGGLADNLARAQSHAETAKFEPSALLHARLFPDMFDLTRQVQIACDFAKGVSARLAGTEPPSYEDKEASFADLIARVQTTLTFIQSLPAASFVGAAERAIVIRPGTPKERSFNGSDYLLHYGLPQFFFHVTTAYALLRHNGVPLGKKDFMGSY